MEATETCPRCLQPHPLLSCPHLKAIEFEDGHVFGSPGPPRVRRLEFLTPSDYVAAPRAGETSSSTDYPRKPTS